MSSGLEPLTIGDVGQIGLAAFEAQPERRIADDTARPADRVLNLVVLHELRRLGACLPPHRHVLLDLVQLLEGEVDVEREQLVDRHARRLQRERQAIVRVVRQGALAGERLGVEELDEVLRLLRALAPRHDGREVLVAEAVLVLGLGEHRRGIDRRPVDLLDQAELLGLQHDARTELEQGRAALPALDQRAQLAERARAFAHDVDAGLGFQRIDIADLDRIAAEATRFDHADLLRLRPRRRQDAERRQARRRRLHERTPSHFRLLCCPSQRHATGQRSAASHDTATSSPAAKALPTKGSAATTGAASPPNDR